jgi:hypothetical protein
MRSFFAFLACAGFITWAHSCDRKILGLGIGISERNPSHVTYEQQAAPLLSDLMTPSAGYNQLTPSVEHILLEEVVPAVNLTMAPVTAPNDSYTRKIAIAVPVMNIINDTVEQEETDSLLNLPYLHASLSSAHLLQY